MDDDAPPLYVPDLARPAGGDIDPHGRVQCVSCGTRVAVIEADVVGLGYRCARCSVTATDADDRSAHLSVAERRRVWRMPRRLSFAIAGVVMVVIAAVMWIRRWDVAWGTDPGEESLFVVVVCAAAGCFGLVAAPRR